jgi:Tfp pilus assembly protein PilZ
VNVSFAESTPPAKLSRRDDLRDLDPIEILALDEAGFRARYSGTALMRAMWRGMRRNACVVLGNTKDARAPSGAPPRADRRRSRRARARGMGDRSNRSIVRRAEGDRVPPKDKRTINRAKRRLMVRYGTSTADKTAFTKNVSETGLFVQTNSVFKPGTTIQVTIQFPDRQFSMWARVVWAKAVPPQLAHVLECGMGVCFIDPSPEWLSHFQGVEQGLYGHVNRNVTGVGDPHILWHASFIPAIFCAIVLDSAASACYHRRASPPDRHKEDIDASTRAPPRRMSARSRSGDVADSRHPDTRPRERDAIHEALHPAGTHPYDEVEWELRDAVISSGSGEVAFEQRNVEVPKFWSQLATNVVAQKYFRGPLGQPRSASTRSASS